jgi:hypothetical protein
MGDILMPMTKCQLFLILGLLFFFIGGGLRAADATGSAIFFWILCVPFFIGFLKTMDKE